MKTLSNCPVCDHSQSSPFLTVKDYTVSKQDFTIVACEGCGFKYTNPRPQDSKLGLYYKSENYISHSDTKKGIVAKLYHAVRWYALKRKLQLVEKNVSRGTLLDYGCGTGAFAEVCFKAGWSVTGYEPDSDARRIAVSRGIAAIGDFKEISSKANSFDAITLWHVMEHIPDLNEKVQQLFSFLKPEGYLFVAVPNYKSYDGEHYGAHWAAYDVPRHLSHFDQSTMKRLLMSVGFQWKSTLPMTFDSFYVSILSEQYKTGQKASLYKAFMSGWKSNAKAKRSGEYSSLIYIFKKS